MRLNLLDILKKQIAEQGGKFKSMVDLQGKTVGDYYAGAVIGDDMSVTDVLSKTELENYGGEVDFDGSPEEVDKSEYSNIDFRDGVVNSRSKPSEDKINPSLLKDVDRASGIAGTKGSITTAVSGHDPGTRHERGLAVDLAMFDGVGYSTEKVAIERGIRDKIEKFVRALESMGYLINPKGGEKGTGADKVVLYFGFPNHEHHVHVSRLSYDKESGTPKKETETKKESDKNDGKTVVFGGIGYATPTWMKSQWESAGLPTNNVIFLPYDSSDYSKIKKNNKITKIVGFSAGGADVWDEIISNSGQYSFMGLIDPSTSFAAYDKYINGGLPSNVKSLSNHENWDDYPKIQKILKDLEKNKVLTHTNLSHEKIPLEFFKKYKSNLS